MKRIMISIKPEYVCNILNKEKLLEIRKSIPKCVLNGEECIVEMYCTKDPNKILAGTPLVDGSWKCWSRKDWNKQQKKDCGFGKYNGKVVARWHLKDCEKFYFEYSPLMFINDYIGVKTNKKFDYKKACLTKEELVRYAYDGEILPQPIYAWHIEDLHIYDKPKELSDFKKENKCHYANYEQGCCFENCTSFDLKDCDGKYSKITVAPQSWFYIKGE